MSSQEQAYQAIIDDLYTGTVDDLAWRRALIGMADLVSGAAAFIFCVNPSTTTVLRDEFYRWDPVAAESYRNIWITKDIRVAPSLNIPTGEAIFEKRLLPIRQWQSCEVYNDFLFPNDSPWFLVFFLHSSSSKVVNFSINSTRTRGPFDEHDGERIKPLIPHVRRALEIKDRLEAAQVRVDTLAASLETVSFGVIFLNKAGRILEANDVAQEMLRSEHVINLSQDGTLRLGEPAGSEFDGWIHRGVPSSHNADGLLHVPRRFAKPISVVASPLPPTVNSWTSDHPRWMLLLFDPDRRVDMSTEYDTSH